MFSLLSPPRARAGCSYHIADGLHARVIGFSTSLLRFHLFILTLSLRHLIPRSLTQASTFYISRSIRRIVPCLFTQTMLLHRLSLVCPSCRRCTELPLPHIRYSLYRETAGFLVSCSSQHTLNAELGSSEALTTAPDVTCGWIDYMKREMAGASHWSYKARYTRHGKSLD